MTRKYFLRIIEKNPILQIFLRFLFLKIVAKILSFSMMGNRKRKSVLFVGQAYYINWYLSRSLRKRGWIANVLNWDLSPSNQIYYHGEDFVITYEKEEDVLNYLNFYIQSLFKYDVFHFANMGGLQFGEPFRSAVKKLVGEYGFEIRFLKALGKKIVYSNNGCLDGVAQSSFASWKPSPVCSICRWQGVPTVCSDESNLMWGLFRNQVSDYQCLLGGNRADYNINPNIHEVPEYFCLDAELWRPDLEIPLAYQYKFPKETLLLYHSVGNHVSRTSDNGVNIKCTHIYEPLIDKFKKEGMRVEMIFCTDVPNKEVRFYQAQADIFLEMLTYGWFGANAREAMMLGKPVVCYLRPEWLESVREEIPEYVDELPIINATPETVEVILRDLIVDKKKQEEIGRRGREFALKWHSAEAGARRFDDIYSKLLGINK